MSSIQGDPGPPGGAGVQGPQGTPGPKGNDGHPGPDGNIVSCHLPNRQRYLLVWINYG